MTCIIRGILFLGFLGILEAAPVGNIYAPAILYKGIFLPDVWWGNFRFGYDWDNTFQKPLNHKGYPLKNIRLKTKWTAGAFIFNVKERLDIYSYLGSARQEINFSQVDNFYSAKNTHAFLWNLGAKLLLIEIYNFSFGVDGKYEASKFGLHFPNPAGFSHVSMHAWQVALGISQKIFYFIPYFGITVCYTTLNIKPFHLLSLSQMELKFRDLVGVFYGLSFSPGSYFFINIEGRSISETALGAAIEVRF